MFTLLLFPHHFPSRKYDDISEIPLLTKPTAKYIATLRRKSKKRRSHHEIPNFLTAPYCTSLSNNAVPEDFFPKNLSGLGIRQRESEWSYTAPRELYKEKINSLYSRHALGVVYEKLRTSAIFSGKRLSRPSKLIVIYTPRLRKPSSTSSPFPPRGEPTMSVSRALRYLYTFSFARARASR